MVDLKARRYEDIAVTLEGEEAVFSWRDGKVHCEEYDLESERAVLALTRFGKGIGVLLVAMNDCCKTEAEFMSEVQLFIVEHERALGGDYDEWMQGHLLFEYLSYSSHPEIRWGGMERARLSERHYKRIMKESEMSFKIRMAPLLDLPEKYFYQLLKYDVEEIKYNLAYNKNCPIDLLEILCSANEASVRWCVAANPSCPPRLLEHLALDKSAGVMAYVAQNQNCLPRTLEILAQDEESEVRWSVAQNQKRRLEILAKDQDKYVAKGAKSKLRTDKGL